MSAQQSVSDTSVDSVGNKSGGAEDSKEKADDNMDGDYFEGPVPTFTVTDSSVDPDDNIDTHTKADDKSEADEHEKDTNTHHIDGHTDGSAARLETRSAGGSLPNSRKVSFMSEPGLEIGTQAHSAPQADLLHPGYGQIPFPHHRKMTPSPLAFFSGEPSSRKTSFFGDPASRKTSTMEAFAQHPALHKISRAGQKISVFSIGGMSDTGTIHGDMMESLPYLDNYRDYMDAYDIRQRPTLFQLREDEQGPGSGMASPLTPDGVQFDVLADELVDDHDMEKGNSAPVASAALKFGWIQGVLIRCMLSIFGVMLFLRLSWITGQAGIGFTTVIIVLSSTVTAITTMSMSAICTNGEVKGGGAYYMISRSLGPEFGGSIGIVFALANAIGASMYIVGFAETVRDIMWENDAQITGHSTNEVRIVGVGICCLCLAIILIGMEWEAKAQIVLLGILSLAILNFFIGTFIPPSDEKRWKGVVGYGGDTFTTNFGPHFTDGNSFFAVFSIFFPAATGVLAGANISGDLKDPQTAIPKGTFLAILVTTIIYVAMVWAGGACMLLNAVGPDVPTVDAFNNTISPTIEVVQDCARFNETCDYGLLNETGMVGIVAAWRPLILAGIFSATLSSALASMVGAPKVFQALAKDKLFPYIHIFGKEFGPSKEPRRGYFLCFGICIAMTCVGSLDLIAPIISNFFLMAYAMINFSCFDASVANSPGFRPGFRYYNKWVSLVGSLLCLAVMFLINWWAALVTFVIVAGLYSYVKISKPEVNWGSSTQANAYRDALKSSLHLVNVEEHVKNFRPQILLLSGYPRNRAGLVDFSSAITKKQSLLICGHVFQGDLSEHINRVRSLSAYRWFKSRKVKAFYNSVAAPTFRIGVQVLLQALGVGKMRPNTLVLGFKTDWQKAEPTDVLDYYDIIQDALDMRYGVGILRVPGGFDRNVLPDDLDTEDENILDSDEEAWTEEEQTSDTDTTATDYVQRDQKEDKEIKQKKSSRSTTENGGNKFKLKRLNTLDEGIENMAYEKDGSQTAPISSRGGIASTNSMFREKHYGTIDVWWLYDDGGLTLLIPYILSQRKLWRNCKLRVFCMASKRGDTTEDERRMANLLGKFRIEYSELTILTEMHKKPQLTTYREFESLIQQWRLRPGEFQEEYLWKIADADLIAHKTKTYRHLRLREKLQEHSKEASLIVMTLPMPKKTACPAGLYMGWLEILTKSMPPIFLLRGNQESVLTYYS